MTDTKTSWPDWVEEFPGAVTVCDLDGVVLAMNGRARQTFARWGGAALLGKSLLECHPEPARGKLLSLLASGGSNSYTIEKNGIRKLIHQAPWFEAGQRRGMVELSLEIPPQLPHYVRS
jgi:PAS domain-containing protein